MPDVSLRLSDTQEAFCFDEHRMALFLGGVGAGKSHAGAVKPMLQVFPNRPALGLVVAPTYPMLRDATLRTALEVWAPLVAKVVHHEMRVELINGHEIIFRSADEPDRLRAINASWVWFDEAAMCHPDTWPIVIGRLRQFGEAGRAWVTTTPKGMNWLYDTFVIKATAEMAIFRAATRSNPFLDQSFVDTLVSQYEGEFAKQELEAEFVAGDLAALIHYEWIAEAVKRWRDQAEAPQQGELVLGLDVSRYGDDETCSAVRRGQRVLSLDAWQGFDLMRTTGRVAALARQHLHAGPVRINVDEIGMGAGVVDRLAELEFDVGGVNVSIAAEDTEKFMNKRAELFHGLMVRFREGDIAIPDDQTLIGQLASLQYKYNSRGQLVIESKDDMKRRGVKSPDRAEALMLAYAPESQAQQLARAVSAVSSVREPASGPIDPYLALSRPQRRPVRPWGKR